MMRLQQGFAVGEMGFNGHFAGQHLEHRRSALGQKQTSHQGHAMSALPPKADMAGPQSLPGSMGPLLLSNVQTRPRHPIFKKVAKASTAARLGDQVS
jgi:hypothetical protein